jgi:hypothetical protein
MLEDVFERAPRPESPSERSIENLLHPRGVRYVSYEDWHRIDAVERLAGEVAGRVRAKLTTTEEMLAVLDDYEKSSVRNSVPLPPRSAGVR